MRNLLAKVWKGLKAMAKKLGGGVYSLATLQWLRGGRVGPPPIEAVADDVEEPAPSDQAHDQAFETEANPFARARKGFEPQDVRNYLRAESSHERGELSSRLKTTTWQWAESLSEPQRKAVLASSNEALKDHLAGRAAIDGVPTTGAALARKLRDPGMNPMADDRRVVSLKPEHMVAANVVFGKRANDKLPAREAGNIESGAVVAFEDAKKEERRKRARGAESSMPRPAAGGRRFG